MSHNLSYFLCKDSLLTILGGAHDLTLSVSLATGNCSSSSFIASVSLPQGLFTCPVHFASEPDDPFILWQDIKICLHKLCCVIDSLKNVKYVRRYFLKGKRRGSTTCVCYGVTQTDYWIMVEDNNHQAVWAWTKVFDVELEPYVLTVIQNVHL